MYSPCAWNANCSLKGAKKRPLPVKVRLLPPACRALYKPGMMVVKMIEESYNEPFKTGPLIDQQGHYAIFDILMNRTMFDYMSAHNLFTRARPRSLGAVPCAIG